MPKNPNTVGGGSQTNVHGLHFEQTTELRDVFANHPQYSVKGNAIYNGNAKVATLFQKSSLYKDLLEPKGVDYKKYISKKMLPDDAILVHSTSTLFIIEKKFQSCAGSVDEKLQTCDFKKKQYTKLLQPLKIKVEYCYFLSDWFLKEEYRDVKKYIISVGCRYFFKEIPLEYLGL
ncbi:hypothetical protein [Parabacteroides sp. AM08-6]|uniref:hypothetical protein n=1 Tax=Parabacteroides sp. AM08-6 TaxID=2292053 RepID=UPI000EFE0B7C|nr:hypothetical protein [Parabacteroides sp. AM08-6]RHJ78128.1 hypothetical protein DW103_15500 [Parabacteroides sp. AM08-6]